jgi:hypothetical protein
MVRPGEFADPFAALCLAAPAGAVVMRFLDLRL